MFVCESAHAPHAPLCAWGDGVVRGARCRGREGLALPLHTGCSRRGHCACASSSDEPRLAPPGALAGVLTLLSCPLQPLGLVAHPATLSCTAHSCHSLRQRAPHPTLQECAAGTAMGAMLGSLIFLFSHIWNGISTDVGLTVAIALPVRPHALRAKRGAGEGGAGRACLHAWRHRPFPARSRL